jgi:zinc transporter
MANKYSWLSENDKAKLNETTNLLIRFIEELDSSIERAQIIQQTITNQVSEQLNQRMYVMSVVAALFLPLGFLTGLLGVNVGGIPGTESPYAFSFFVIFLVVITGAIGVYFKNKKWL